ncbi:hypothetical protein [Enterococcus sp. RIT-PI-f]|uniref:hypothetical protein n=1 Tax=Enterococcus sp. RIT-PI-f TaxID=1690244 RepID=UPI0006B9E0CE|nr:hypothetical protein [Enterococcus sp. RIT-PI-f]KPG73293.1 hypothetical protein AEQ18_01395 [Enterococcus sp. RIT-PI-f]
MAGYNRFSKEWQNASKELREGKRKNANKGLKTRQKVADEKNRKADNAYTTGFLIGSFREMFRKK